MFASSKWIVVQEVSTVKRAVSSWSLHRTLGRFVSGDAPGNGGRFGTSSSATDGLALLELPAALRKHGYDSVQICHFHLPSRSIAYLGELRAALAESEIELEAILIDDGDPTSRDDGDLSETWIDGWLETAIELGAQRARVCAGRSAPSAETIEDSAARLGRLAAAHPEIRVITENWLEMTPDATAVLALLDATGPSIGLMIDLGNWRGPDKYRELAAIAPHAETCHAKCHFAETVPDREDFQTSLRLLKESGYSGPLALIYDGSDDDEWANLDVEYAMVREVFV
jgi:sugar phosphate isomerase/epimerase